MTIIDATGDVPRLCQVLHRTSAAANGRIAAPTREPSTMDEPQSQLEEMRALMRADRERAARHRLQGVLMPVDARGVKRRRLRRLLRELRRR
jgi:hypothetical protein